jgi:hypothetical protein
MNYRVRWRDGSTTEGVSYDESMRLIEERPQDWAGVQPMDYASDCDQANVKAKEAAWGVKKKS